MVEHDAWRSALKIVKESVVKLSAELAVIASLPH